MKTITARSHLCLVCPGRFYKITFLEPWQVLLELLQLLNFQGLILLILHFRATL